MSFMYPMSPRTLTSAPNLLKPFFDLDTHLNTPVLTVFALGYKLFVKY